MTVQIFDHTAYTPTENVQTMSQKTRLVLNTIFGYKSSQTGRNKSNNTESIIITTHFKITKKKKKKETRDRNTLKNQTQQASIRGPESRAKSKVYQSSKTTQSSKPAIKNKRKTVYQKQTRQDNRYRNVGRQARQETGAHGY